MWVGIFLCVCDFKMSKMPVFCFCFVLYWCFHWFQLAQQTSVIASSRHNLSMCRNLWESVESFTFWTHITTVCRTLFRSTGQHLFMETSGCIFLLGVRGSILRWYIITVEHKWYVVNFTVHPYIPTNNCKLLHNFHTPEIWSWCYRLLWDYGIILSLDTFSIVETNWCTCILL